MDVDSKIHKIEYQMAHCYGNCKIYEVSQIPTFLTHFTCFLKSRANMSDNGRGTETCSILIIVGYIKLSVAVNTHFHCFITTPTYALFFRDVTFLGQLRDTCCFSARFMIGKRQSDVLTASITKTIIVCCATNTGS